MREEIEEMIAKNRIKTYMEAAHLAIKLSNLLSVITEEKSKEHHVSNLFTSYDRDQQNVFTKCYTFKE